MLVVTFAALAEVKEDGMNPVATGAVPCSPAL